MSTRERKLKDINALAIVLYELNYDRNSEIEKWTNHQKEYFLDLYSLERIQNFGLSIQNFFKYNDIDILSIHPNMAATKDEREAFLEFILNGFIDKNLLD